MRLWIARIFLLSVFALQWTHNLVVHHHSSGSAESHEQGHDHEEENRPIQQQEFVFGGLDHAFTHGHQSIEVVKTISSEAIPATLAAFLPARPLADGALRFKSPPPESPPPQAFLSSPALRGPPAC